MATTIPATPRDPEGVDVPVGGPYNTGPNPYPGGTLEVNDVTPLDDRSDGTSEAALAQQASISRQLP
jgi:hypothetical protein